MALETLILMFATGASPAGATSVETWLDTLTACPHELKKGAPEATRPATSEIVRALDGQEMTPIHALRAIEQLSSRHVAQRELAEVVSLLRRIAEKPGVLRLRIELGEEVGAEDRAAYKTWLFDRVQNTAADALATYGYETSRKPLAGEALVPKSPPVTGDGYRPAVGSKIGGRR